MEDESDAKLTYARAFDCQDKADTEQEYAYNENGAMTKDLNKGITNIEYDLLGNPRKVTFGSRTSIEYVYAADGRKLRTVHSAALRIRVVPSGNKGKLPGYTYVYLRDTTDYINNYVFKNGKPEMFRFPGGYYSFDEEGKMDGCHLYVQDYQSNNRLVVNAYTDEVEQINHYYPYGALMGDISTKPDEQKYKFGGKELDRKFGLDLHDFEARQQDPLVGRFTSIDPLAEKNYGLSPYAYCAGDPINLIDPTGMDTLYFTMGSESKIANYQSRIKAGGDHVGMILGDEGNLLYQFSFAYQDDANRFMTEEEKAQIEDKLPEGKVNEFSSKVLSQIILLSKQDIRKFLSGIPSMNGGISAWLYAYNGSRGEGTPMDFMYKINQKYGEQMFIPINGAEKVAQDKYNLGNYLWGAAMKKLGISLLITRCGAHVDSWKNNLEKDSEDDQNSIKLGYDGGY